MQLHLKIKISSLAAEARIIRRLERKQRGGERGADLASPSPHRDRSKRGPGKPPRLRLPERTRVPRSREGGIASGRLGPGGAPCIEVRANGPARRRAAPHRVEPGSVGTGRGAASPAPRPPDARASGGPGAFNPHRATVRLRLRAKPDTSEMENARLATRGDAPGMGIESGLLIDRSPRKEGQGGCTERAAENRLRADTFSAGAGTNTDRDGYPTGARSPKRRRNA